MERSDSIGRLLGGKGGAGVWEGAEASGLGDLTGQEWVQTALKQEQILAGSYNDPAECLFGLTCPEF